MSLTTGSDLDTTLEIQSLITTVQNLGADDSLVEEALKNPVGGNHDSRKIIGLLKLLADIVSGGGGGTFSRSDTRPTNLAKKGDVTFNSSPQPQGNAGWIYTDYGWLSFGTIEGIVEVPYKLSDGTQFLVSDGNGGSVNFICSDFAT